jgi:hypothetical protein
MTAVSTRRAAERSLPARGLTASRFVVVVVVVVAISDREESREHARRAEIRNRSLAFSWPAYIHD